MSQKFRPRETKLMLLNLLSRVVGKDLAAHDASRIKLSQKVV